jgi:phosphoglycerate kinase
VEEDRLEVARAISNKAKARGVELLLPVDHVCGREFAEDTELTVTEDAAVPTGWMGLDIGPKTIEHYGQRIAKAKTVIWNGPMGVFEWEAFAKGTMAMARSCAESGAVTIVGGGDSVSAVKKSGLVERFSHISTGGGASLELLEGKQLPGVAVLTDK